MVHALATLLLIISLGMPSEVQAKNLSKRFEPILKKWKFSSSSFGLQVENLKTGTVLYSHHGSQTFNPASTIKLLTSAVALDKLGPSHQFITGLYQSGPNVCLKGGGDPALVSERVWLMVREARRQGLRNIKGDLWLDTTLFPREEFGGKFKGDRNRAFTAPISSLLVNFNSLTIYGSPTTVGKPPTFTLDPDLPLFQLKNRAKTRVKAGRKDVNASIRSNQKTSLDVTAWGKIGLNQSEVTLYRSVPEPSRYAGHLFAQLFQKAGGSFQGQILPQACPSQAQEILQFKSLPLSQIIYGMNKFSNNVIAEMLLRSLGETPTRESGLAALEAWLKDHKISRDSLTLVSASGLSRRNRVSPQTLTQIIRVAANDLRIGPEFLSSLGIAGQDGTLRRRLAKNPHADRVRGKSGRLTGVVALAGVAASPSLGNVAYAFLFHPPAQRGWDAQKMEEDLLQAIIAYDGQ